MSRAPGLAALLIACAHAPASKPTALHGLATFTDAHCGGGVDRLLLLRGGQDRSATLRIERDGARAPLATFLTDARGGFEVQLEPGSYCVVRADRAVAVAGGLSRCSPSRRCDGELTVAVGQTELTLELAGPGCPGSECGGPRLDAVP